MAATALFLTPTIVKLHMISNNQELGTATGFFISVGSRKYLVSAWHVLSGRDPRNGQPRLSHGAVPDHVKFRITKVVGDEIVAIWKEIYLGDVTDRTVRWCSHPELGQDVDVGVIPLEDGFDSGVAKDLLDIDAHDPDMFVDTGAEVFLPGFPLGLGDGQFPVWKRASVATSLEWGLGMSHCFLIDTASREGMSGAPCIMISNWRHYRMDRKTGKVQIVEKPLSHRFLGVYSGRINAHDDLGAQLGFVWRETRVFETISAESRATVLLRRASA